VAVDYYPLVKGRVMSYRSVTTGGEGSVDVETLGVCVERGLARAQCRRTARGPAGTVTRREFRVEIDGAEVRGDGDVEFLLPALPGRAWRRPPREYSVETLDGRVDTPCGAYERCLVVLYTIAGGDAGLGRRYYAPGVGFVHESCEDEGDPFELSLTAVREP
jgi:hypothetical protein